MMLTVDLRARISPRASTVIFCDRSPRATAVVTWAMLRTWPVRLEASWLTLSVRSFHVPDTPGTMACPPRRPSVPTSRATRVTSSAKPRSWSTIVLMVSFSSATSPRASTVIFCDRSPWATAVVTWAMLRTWLVRLAASWLTLSVRSFQVPNTPGTSAWPPGRPPVRTPRAALFPYTTLFRSELVDHRVDGLLQLGHLAPGLDGDLLGEVAPGHGRRDLGDVADLAGEVPGQLVDVVGERLPGAGDPGHLGLAAEAALGADLAGHPGDLVGEAAELVDHGVDGALELEDLTPHLDEDLLREVAVGHGGGALGDVLPMAGEVRGQLVDVVGEVLPRARHALDVGLAAEAAVGADLPGDPGDLVGEGGELV